jgi:hypothetical protein
MWYFMNYGIQSSYQKWPSKLKFHVKLGNDKTTILWNNLSMFLDIFLQILSSLKMLQIEMVAINVTVFHVMYIFYIQSVTFKTKNIKYQWISYETCLFVICCARCQPCLTWRYLHVEAWPCHDVKALEEKMCGDPAPLLCNRILLHDHSALNHFLLSHVVWKSNNDTG